MTPRITLRTTPGIQRIQAAISQTSLQGQTQGSTSAAVGQPSAGQSAASQSVVCSFEIEGRRQAGYLGVHSIAEVTPPCFPKDAFQLRSRRGKAASPMITLKQERPKSERQPAVQASIPDESCQTITEQVTSEPSKSTSAPVTAETLTELFEQAELTSAPQSHSAILTPVTVSEQTAAQTLAQTLSSSKTIDISAADALQDLTDEAISDPRIKPIETVARPALPRSKSPEFSLHQNNTNPMLPLELLQNIGQEVIVWQEALQVVHQKIQSLYQEGPILNGWLEKPAHNQTYLLCRLDSTGQSWRSPCPPKDLQQTSLAIGRYKRLRSLLGEKQRLDQRIKRLSETLTMLRLRLRAY